ncbi:flavin reductase like domain-containing protein [Rhodofomes roseus]|uniref:Flavin reductase like domain-containing protein n=1 Tax=Rhodofomes roseus TaxID=34475 RepID=A0ABQ8KPE9_9APHY|nr:flavin reductase like domain-containing protein [Rhodofomes roseus]KAH9840025.1 flavin reductase like domain-containing protein [Rhodofomes roseus]
MLPRKHLSSLRRTPRRRHLSTSNQSASSADAVRRDLRALLRDTAQPVAVVTSLMPAASSSVPKATSSPHSRFHGATLSSFTSIALDPHPLVAFSLRIPSRMATSLSSAHTSPPSPNSHPTPTPATSAAPAHASPHLPAQLVINILSAAQPAVAARFARPDLHADPFAHTPYALSTEGLPVLAGALGALSCRLVAASWPLHDLESLQGRESGARAWEGDGVASELFIAQVTRVEEVPRLGQEREAEDAAPLLYYRRAYATTRPLRDEPYHEKKP